MLEKINLLKWVTELSPEKRVVLYSVLIIGSLGWGIYGMVKYIHGDIVRNEKVCLDDKHRLTSERDYYKDKYESSRDYHLNYVEKEIEEVKRIREKTNNLEKQIILKNK